jgi:hypothetical protein
MGKTAVVKSVDPAKKQVHFSSGKTVQYKNLVSTMALDGLLDRLDVPKEKLDPLLDAAKGLVFSSTIVLGLGIRGTRPERIGDKCKRFTPFSTIRYWRSGWLYFPEDDAPFYRATIFSNYSDFNTPAQTVKLSTIQRAASTNEFEQGDREGPYWSIMFEVCQSEQRHVNLETLLADTIKGAVATELLRPEDEIVSTYMRRFDHG